MKMKVKMVLAVICMVFMFASLCQAYPAYTVNAGPNRLTDGGPFIITGNGYNYDTFCVETGEFISLGGTYQGTIDPVVYYGTPAGNTVVVNAGVALNANTKTLYDYYLDNQASLNTNGTLLAKIQHAIWAWQGQEAAPVAGTNDYYDNPQNYVGTARDIEVLNLWTLGGTAYTAADAAQSMLIPVVPIPAAVWLLGTGLVGLLGIRRRFQK